MTIELVALLPPDLCRYRNLRTLHIFDCDIAGFPEFFGQMASLRTLEVARCERLTSILPGIGELKGLEKLSFIDCASLELRSEAFTKGMQLRVLEFSVCPMLGGLPDSVCRLPKVRSIRLDRCGLFASLSEMLGRMRKLEKLYIDSCPITELPVSIGRLRALTELTVRCCPQLECLPRTFWDITSIKVLSFEGCSRLSGLGDISRHGYALEALDISHTRIKTLPSEIGRLSRLAQIHLVRSDVECLPASFVHLGQIRDLVLGGKMIGFPALVYGMPNLAHLTVHTASADIGSDWWPQSASVPPSLETLRLDCVASAPPQWVLSAPTLRTIELVRLDMESLPKFVSRATSLEDLVVDSCIRLRELPSDLCSASLTVLKLRFLYSLKSIPDSVRELRALQTLDIFGCSELEKLPDSLCYLPSLRVLELRSCDKLSRLPESFGSLRALQELRITNLKNFEGLPESTVSLACLSTLVLGYLGSVTSLPDGLGAAQPLSILTLDTLPGLTSLPESALVCTTLSKLVLSSTGLSPCVLDCARLPMLDSLVFNTEYETQYFSRGIANFPALTFLCLRSPGLEELPDEVCGLSCLRTLKVCSRRIRFLPAGLERLDRLLCVALEGCTNLEYIHPDIWPLSQGLLGSPFSASNGPRTMLCLVDCSKYRDSMWFYATRPSFGDLHRAMRPLVREAVLCCKRRGLWLPPELWFIIWHLAAAMHKREIDGINLRSDPRPAD